MNENQLPVTYYIMSYLSIRSVFLPVVTAPRNFNSSFSFATVNIANAMFTRMPQNTTAPLPAKGADKPLANPINLSMQFIN
jgi:hypothetical protein